MIIAYLISNPQFNIWNIFAQKTARKKHQTLEKCDNFENRRSCIGYSPFRDYSLCKMVSLGQKLKVEEDDCEECTPQCAKQKNDTNCGVFTRLCAKQFLFSSGNHLSLTLNEDLWNEMGGPYVARVDEGGIRAPWKFSDLNLILLQKWNFAY